MTSERFTDRLFYLDATDEVVHIHQLALNIWALEVLLDRDGLWRWEGVALTTTYEECYQVIRHSNPVLLLEEMD